MKWTVCLIIFWGLLILLTGVAVAEERLRDLIHESVFAKLQAQISQGSNANQTEASTTSDNSTSLVDQSSVSDLVAVALNLADLSSGSKEESETTSVSVSVTAYSVYAALMRKDPLEPRFYNAGSDWRRLSVTLGYDKKKPENNTGEIEQTTIAGVKVLIVNDRDASKVDEQLKNKLDGLLREVIVEYASMTRQIEHTVFALTFPTLEELDQDLLKYKSELQKDAEANQKKIEELLLLLAALKTKSSHLEILSDERIFRSGYWTSWLNRPLTADVKKKIDDHIEMINAIIDEHLDPLIRLSQASREIVSEIRKKPQFSVSYFAKLRETKADEHSIQAVFEYGLREKINLVLNGSYTLQTGSDLEDKVHAGRVAGELQLQITPERYLDAKSTLRLNFSGEAKFIESKDSIYKGQVKFIVPITKGIELPLSLTFSNRSELIDEAEVRGQVGFTIDASKLTRLFSL